MSNKAASMRPSDATNAGKFTDIDVEFQQCRFAEAAYQNSDTSTFAFVVDMLDLESNETIANQMFSVGSLEAWTASEDGLHAIPTKDGGTFKKSCNFMLMMDSLVKAGFPEDRIENAGSLDGLRCHIAAKAVPAVSGTDPRTVNIIAKILPNGLPWEASKRKVAKKQGGSGAASVAPSSPSSSGGVEISDELRSYVSMAVLAVIPEGGSVARNQLAKLVMKHISVTDKDTYPAPVRSKVIAAIAHDAVLKSLDGVSYDGAALSAA